MHNCKDSDNERRQLIGELREKCALVEEAISYVATLRHCAEENATQIKDQILIDVTRALDTLRRKEVQLLRQVDVVEAQHLNVLHIQNAELHQLLGNLRHTLYCAERHQDIPASCIVSSDMDLVNSVHCNKFAPPSFAYHSGTSELDAAIQNFGTVTADLAAYHHANRDFPSKCLPSKLEEYEDGDHQLLYKTLEESKTESVQIVKTNLQMPFMSQRNEDWLKECGMPISIDRCGAYQFILPELLLHKDLNFWLKDETYKAMDPVIANLRKENKVEEWLHKMSTKESNENIGNFESRAVSDLSLNSCSSIEIVSSTETDTFSECSFKSNNNLNEMWYVMNLATSEKMSMLNPVQSAESCSQNTCQGKALTVDIENLGSILCSSGDKSHVDDTEKWLVKGGCAKQWECVGIADICRSNEKCSTFNECVSKDECSLRAVEMQLEQLNVGVDKSDSLGQWLRVPFLQVSGGEERDEWLKRDCTSDLEKLDVSEKTIEVDMDSGVALDTSDGYCYLTKSHPDTEWWLASSNIQLDVAAERARCVRDDFQVYFSPLDLNVWLVASTA